MNELTLQKAYDRTDEWNKAGFVGRGVVVWNMEDLSDHGQGTRTRVLDAAPAAFVINAEHAINVRGDLIVGDTVSHGGIATTADFFIQRNGVTILTRSKAATKVHKKPCVADFYRELRDRHNLSLFNSAGNDGADGVKGGALPEEVAIYVGACTMFRNNPGDIRMATYSSIGDEREEVDFSTFTGRQIGTSFAAPYLAGICALLQQRYGKDMAQDEVYQYLRMCAVKIDTGHHCRGNAAYDFWSGYGVPVLPPVSNPLVRMTIGRTDYLVDGTKKTMDAPPEIYGGRTMVPVSFVALELGASVSWDAKDMRVDIHKRGTRVRLWIGKKIYEKDGKIIPMDVAPFIAHSRTMVPVAFVADALGCKVAWIERRREVMILEVE